MSHREEDEEVWRDNSSDSLEEDEYEVEEWDEGDSDVLDLEPCPNCGAEIYEEAPQCPVCGEYVGGRGGMASFWSGRSWWFVLLGGLGILMVILSLFFNHW